MKIVGTANFEPLWGPLGRCTNPPCEAGKQWILINFHNMPGALLIFNDFQPTNIHFDAFSKRKRSRTCRNSFSAVSKAMALRFCTYSALDLLCPNICAASTLSAKKLNFRARTFRPPRGRYILE